MLIKNTLFAALTFGSPPEATEIGKRRPKYIPPPPPICMDENQRERTHSPNDMSDDELGEFSNDSA